MAKFLKDLIDKKNKKRAEAEIEPEIEKEPEPENEPEKAPEAYQTFTKAQAKAELERKIAEKLSSMPETDLSELLRIQEDREKQRQETEKRIEERRRKREKQGKKKAMEPIIVEDAILADFRKPVPAVAATEPEPPSVEEQDAACRLEGQISIMDLNERVRKENPPKPEPLIVAQEDELPAVEDQTMEEMVAELFPIKEEHEQHGETELPAALVVLRRWTKKAGITLKKYGRRAKKHLQRVLADCDMFTDKIYAVVGSVFMVIGAGFKKIVLKFYEKKPEALQRQLDKNKKHRVKLKIFVRNLIKKERMAAIRMIHFINRVDDRNDELAGKTTEMVAEGGRKFNFAREWADLNKKRLLSVSALILMVALGGVAVFNHLTAYEYAYNNRTLGLVKDQEDVLRILDLVSDQLSREHKAEISIDRDRDITFKRVLAFNEDMDDMEDVLKRLTYMQDMNAKGYGIYVDGKRVAIVDRKETADEILQTVQNLYIKSEDSVEYESIGFAETVEIKPIETKLGNLMNPERVKERILTGAVAQKTHVVEAGETFSDIAKYYSMSMADLLATNPEVTPEKLQIGQELILTQAVPLLTVQTVEIATYREAIPFETAYENNDAVYKGEQRVKVAGANGEREVVAKIVRNNNVEVGKQELSSTIIEEPVNALIMVGTKALPPLQGTGHLIKPVSGYKLTSKFGGRWGRMHEGIDMACKTGTSIRAADGGTVVAAGYHSTYGYMIEISHGQGMNTVYAHCSKLFVSKGEKVYQGQHIANVGNTGRSTGPHLHFEVRINGAVKNPLNYI